jgi:hypothetical protein
MTALRRTQVIRCFSVNAAYAAAMVNTSVVNADSGWHKLREFSQKFAV